MDGPVCQNSKGYRLNGETRIAYISCFLIYLNGEMNLQHFSTLHKMFSKLSGGKSEGPRSVPERTDP